MKELISNRLKTLANASIPYALPGVGILALAIIGARTQNIYILYGLIGVICLAVILVAFDRLSERCYPYLIFSIGLSLLWQTSLMSPGLVGSDIHSEYYFLQLSLEEGWDSTNPHLYNLAFGTTVIAPMIVKVFHISEYWILKALYPFLFAFVPLLLYWIYRKQFGDKKAFLGVFFFISVPTWSLELVGLPRQQIAELFFALSAFLIIVSKWKLGIKIPLIIVSITLSAMCHYVVGPIAFFYLVVVSVIILFFKKRTFPAKYIILITAVFFITGTTYYASVGEGAALQAISKTIYKQAQRVTVLLPVVPDMPPYGAPEPVPSAPGEPYVQTVTDTTKMPGLEPLVRTALGLDFNEASPLGKAFRIFQFITQVALVLGSLYLLRYRRRFNPQFICFVVASAILLSCSIAIPRFANLINLTRMYHMGLFFAAPACILGGLLIFRNPKVLTLCLLIPYFLFTSGVLFEVTKHTNTSIADVPYSIALSHERIDVCAVFTKNDILVMRWARENNLKPIYLDINGMLLFSEEMEREQWRMDYYWYPNGTDVIPDGAYLFLRERNNQKKEVTFKPQDRTSATGMRVSFSYEEFGLDEIIENGEVIYQLGDATIIRR